MSRTTRIPSLLRLAVAATLAAMLVAVGTTPAQAATYDTATVTVQTTNVPAGEVVTLHTYSRSSTGASYVEGVVDATGKAVFNNVPTGRPLSLGLASRIGSQVHRQMLGGEPDDGDRFEISGDSAEHTVRFDAQPSAWIVGSVSGSAEALANGRVWVNIWSDITNGWTFQSTANIAADGTYRVPVRPGSTVLVGAESKLVVDGVDVPFVTAYPFGRTDLPSKDDTSFMRVAPAAGETVTAHPLAFTTLTARLDLTLANLDPAVNASVTLTSLRTGSSTISTVPGSSSRTSFTRLAPGPYLVRVALPNATYGAAAVMDLTGTHASTLTIAEPRGVLILSNRLDGNAQVGALQTLRSSVRPSATDATVTTSWTGNGEVLATGQQYRLTARDLHTYVRAVTLATAPGYIPAIAVSAVGYGKVGDAPRATAAPRVTGTVAAGRTVNVTSGSWDADGTTTTVQWTRDGAPIIGATGTSYAVSGSDVGRQIDAVITATAPGHSSGALIVTGARAARGAAAPYAARTTGTAKVGRTLTAAAAPSGWKASYRWYRSGKVIKGATKRTYRPTSADVGKTLKVRVTLARPGFTTTTKTSSATKKIVRATAALTAKAGKGKATLRVKVTGVTRPTGTLTVRHGSTTTRVVLKAKHRGSVTVKLPRGTRTVKISYSGSAGIAKASKTVKLKVR